MHHIDLMPEVSPLVLRGERQPRGLLHGKRIHVGTQGNNRSGLCAAPQGDHAGLRDASLYLQAKFPEMRCYERGCTYLLFAKLGMLVNVAPPGNELLLDLRGALADFLLEVLRGALADFLLELRTGLGARRRSECERNRAENESSPDVAQHGRLPSRQA